MKCLILCTLVLFLSGFKRQDEPKKKYNFLFIMVDDLRPTLGSYGHGEVSSPNIDKLSSEGVQFNKAYCNVPVCGASRASLLTGTRPLYPDRFIIHTSRADEDFPGAITLPMVLKNNGYYTVSNGKIFHDSQDSEDSWSEKPWRDEEGSRQYAEPPPLEKLNKKTGRGPFFDIADVPDTAYADGRLAEKSIRDLQRLSKSRQPFFLAVGFVKPHLPFIAPAKYFDLYPNTEIAANRFEPRNLPAQSKTSNEIRTYGYTEHYNTEEFHAEARRAYYACVSYIDTQIGKLMAELKILGLEENTIVVLIGDHGFHLGEHNFWGKHNTHHESLHAPLIIKVPGKQPSRIDNVVEFVDLYPTVCELADLKVPEQVDGESLLRLIDQKKGRWKNSAFCEWRGARSLMTDRFGYTYWFEEKNNGAEMLYDYSKDPQGNVNVAAEPAYAKVVRSHKRKIQKLYAKMEAERE